MVNIAKTHGEYIARDGSMDRDQYNSWKKEGFSGVWGAPCFIKEDEEQDGYCVQGGMLGGMQ